MSKGSGTFSLIGVLCATDDAPSLCTPLFRNAEGKRCFIQSFQNRRRIDSFEFIGDQIGGYRVDILSNVNFEVGSEVQFGLILPKKTTIVMDLDGLCSFFHENASIFIPWPFMFYQLAITCRNQSALMDAFGLTPVREAIAKRQIPLVFPRSTPEEGRWNDNTSHVLEMLWEFAFSAAEIGRILGFSRNAVLSKAQRLGLSAQPEKLPRIGKSRPRRKKMWPPTADGNS
ncbi:GcrA cell cycle regulator [Rhizobium sp. PP-F2F-G36]|nr:GcrA cell cycle regulator [Rhizobium sp. PP-F2F-G36]